MKSLRAVILQDKSPTIILSLCLPLALIFLTPAPAHSDYHVADTILLSPAEYGHEPWGAAFDPLQSLVYVADLPEPGKVTVIDAATHSIVDHIELSGLYAHGICVNDRTGRAYVANYGTDDVSVIDTLAAEEIATIAVGDTPRAVCVNRATDRIYVTRVYDGALTVIDGRTLEVVGSIDVGDYPYDVAVNEMTNRIYTANCSSWDVSVVDGATGLVIETIDVGRYPCGVCVNEATGLVYVTNRDDGTVSVIHGVTHQVLDVIGVGLDPHVIAVNPESNRIYAVNAGSSTVSVIDGNDDAVVTTVNVGRNPVGGICIDRAADEIYVTNYDSDDISVIDGHTDEVAATIQLGFYPRELSVDPDARRLYVSNGKGNDLAVIEGTGIHGHGVVPALPWTITKAEVGYSPGPSALDHDAGLLYLLVPDRDELLMLDTSTGALLARAKTGDYPTGVAVNTVTRRIYVTHSETMEVRVYDSDTLARVAVIPTSFQTLDVAVNETTDKIFVTMWMGLLLVIDGETHTVIDSVYLHGFCEPKGVAVNEVTDKVYVAGLNCNVAWVVDGTSHEILAQLPLLTFPGGIGVDPVLNHAFVCTGDLLTVIGKDHSIIEEVKAPVPLSDAEADPSRAQIIATSYQERSVVVFQSCTDADGDLYSPEGEYCGPADCDDADPDVNPGMVEGPPESRLCDDGIDNDCDGLTDRLDPGCSSCFVASAI